MIPAYVCVAAAGLLLAYGLIGWAILAAFCGFLWAICYLGGGS